MRKVLLIEDDPVLRENTAELLELSAYEVVTASNGKKGVKAAKKHLPNVIVCDIMMPELDGYGVLDQLGKDESTRHIPFIFLSAKTEKEDIRKGMNLGADDYLTKDISLTQVMVRISALFRRIDALKTNLNKDDDLIEVDQLKLDVNRFTATWSDSPIEITLTEFWILNALAKHPGHVRTREQLMEAAKAVVDDSTVTSHIKRLRKKITALDNSFDKIETVYGMGYRWKP